MTPAGEPTLVVSEVFGPTFQGEGPTLGRRAAFVRLGRCNLDCRWCFAADTPILRADWSWTPIGELAVGDLVVGRSLPSHGRHGRLLPTTVLALRRRRAPTVLIDGGIVCTPDHEFWVAGDRGHRSGWRAIERCTGTPLTYITSPTRVPSAAWERGWLAGVADGDGCFWTLRTKSRPGREYRRFRLAMNDHASLDRFLRLAGDHGYVLREGLHSHEGFGGRATMRSLRLTVDRAAREFEAYLAENEEADDWAWGYLGGMIDAEGSLSGCVLRVAQDPIASPRTWKRLLGVLEQLGLRYTAERRGVYVSRSEGRLWELLTCSRPTKASILRSALGHAPNHRRWLASVVPAGENDVVMLTTDLGSFVAGGYVVRNCDTPYTWDWERFDPAVELAERPVADVVAEVEAMGVDRVVVTGGEPLLQQRRLLSFLDAAVDRGWAVEIETNGTLAPTAATTAAVERFNVSPKTSNSGVARERAIVPDALAALVATGKAAFKFVATGVGDLEEIAAIVEEHGLAPVYVMPEGTDASTVTARGRELADAVTARGWHLTTRLHVLLWGDERGR